MNITIVLFRAASAQVILNYISYIRMHIVQFAQGPVCAVTALIMLTEVIPPYQSYLNMTYLLDSGYWSVL